jgi:mannose PTS system EIIA component
VIGILIVTHSGLGESLVHCVNHVLGSKPPLLEELGISMDDDPEEMLPRAQALVKELDRGAGVLVLSDIYGATPCNIVCRLMKPGKVEGIAGVNLPMLIRALSYRHLSLDVVVEKAVAGGVAGVINFTEEASSGHD